MWFCFFFCLCKLKMMLTSKIAFKSKEHIFPYCGHWTNYFSAFLQSFHTKVMFHITLHTTQHKRWSNEILEKTTQPLVTFVHGALLKHFPIHSRYYLILFLQWLLDSKFLSANYCAKLWNVKHVSSYNWPLQLAIDFVVPLKLTSNGREYCAP